MVGVQIFCWALLIALMTPIIIFIKNSDYKNLAIYLMAFGVLNYVDGILVSLAALVVILALAFKALFGKK